MAKRVQRRRGTTAEHATFTGYVGETTVDTTKDTVIVHDGATTAGFPLAREDLSNVNLTNLIGVTELKLTDGSADQVIKTDGSGTISFGTIDVTGSAVGGDISGTVGNAQIVANKVGVAELNVSEGTNGQVLSTNGSGTLSFITVVTDPTLGGHLSGTTSNASINNNTITSAMLTTALKNFTVDEFVGASAQTTFTLTADVGSVNALLVYIDGIVQPATGYSLPTPTSIQFNTAPPASSLIRCLHLGFQSTVGVPSDGTITTPKIAANAAETWSTSSTFGTDLTFWTANNSSSALTKRMTIQDDGLVGIGTATPAFTLDVNGSGIFRNHVYLDDDSGDSPKLRFTEGSGKDGDIWLEDTGYLRIETGTDYNILLQKDIVWNDIIVMSILSFVFLFHSNTDIS